MLSPCVVQPYSYQASRTLTSSNENAELVRFASRHAYLLMLVIALTVVVIHPVGQLLRLLSPIDSLDEFLAMSELSSLMILFSIFTAWSSIWLVLGAGRWWSRLVTILGIFHVAVIMSVVTASLIHEWPRDGVRDPIVMATAASCAFSALLLVNGFFIWLLKLLRFRLVYFQDPATFPHPRRSGIQDGAITSQDRLLLGTGVSIADLMALTTWVAFYFGAYYPMNQFIFADSQFFGPSFLFTIMLAAMAISGLIALPMILMPGVVAMMNNRGQRFQIAFHTLLFLLGCTVVAMLIWEEFIADEGIELAIMAAVGIASYELAMVLVMRRPSRWFRFRLVRRPKP